MQSTQIQVTDSVTTPAATLRDAALYLERHGWVQGAYYDPCATVFTPAACMVGAIGIVCYDGPVDAPAQHFDAEGWAQFEAAMAYLDQDLLFHFGCTAYDFNDAKGRTADDVIAILRDAADEWDRHLGGAR